MDVLPVGNLKITIQPGKGYLLFIVMMFWQLLNNVSDKGFLLTQKKALFLHSLSHYRIGVSCLSYSKYWVVFTFFPIRREEKGKTKIFFISKNPQKV